MSAEHEKTRGELTVAIRKIGELKLKIALLERQANKAASLLRQLDSDAGHQPLPPPECVLCKAIDMLREKELKLQKFVDVPTKTRRKDAL